MISGYIKSRLSVFKRTSTDDKMKGKEDPVQRKGICGLLHKYIFIGPMQMSSAFYQINEI